MSYSLYRFSFILLLCVFLPPIASRDNVIGLIWDTDQKSSRNTEQIETAWVTYLQLSDMPATISPEYFVCHVSSSLTLRKEYTSETVREYGAQVNIYA